MRLWFYLLALLGQVRWASSAVINQAQYVCVAGSLDLCLAVPSGGRVVTTAVLPLPLVLKSVAANLLQPCPDLGICPERTKLRFRLSPQNGTIEYSLNPSFCIDGYSATSRIALDVCLQPQATFDLSPFVSDPLSPAPLRHPLTGKCLTVLRCKRNPINNKGFRFFCDRFPTRPVAAQPPYVLGSVVGLLPCDSSVQSQQFSIVRECSPGCAPFDIGNGKCNPSCNNEACSYDSKCRFLCAGDAACIDQCPFSSYECGTPSPTVPTLSPTGAPSGTPSSSPSSSPSTPRPSGHPSSAPSAAPRTSKPTKTPTTTKPTKTPSRSPSTTPSSRPTSSPTVVRPSTSPSASPSRNPSSSPVTSRPTPSPTNSTIVVAANGGGPNLLWLLWLLLLIPCCLLLCCFAWYRRKKDEEDKKEPQEAPKSPEPTTPEPTVHIYDPEALQDVDVDNLQPAPAPTPAPEPKPEPEPVPVVTATVQETPTVTVTPEPAPAPAPAAGVDSAQRPPQWDALAEELKRVTRNQSAVQGNLYRDPTKGRFVLDHEREKMLARQRQSVEMRYTGLSTEERLRRDRDARQILRQYGFDTAGIHALHELEDYVDACNVLQSKNVKPDTSCDVQDLRVTIDNVASLQGRKYVVPRDFTAKKIAKMRQLADTLPTPETPTTYDQLKEMARAKARQE